MVVFLDLSDVTSGASAPDYSYYQPTSFASSPLPPSPPSTSGSTCSVTPQKRAEYHKTNHAHGFSEALARYPFLAGLASHLDHNDLYNLSAVCRQFKQNMSGYRSTLLANSMRCDNDKPNAPSPIVNSTANPWASSSSSAAAPCIRNELRSIRGGSRCATDLVNPCIRCRKPVCRNCIRKPHPNNASSRFRRLCTPCQKEPSLLPSADVPPYEAAREGYPRICRCVDEAWFCSQCAEDLAAEDQSYRLWCEMWVHEFSASSHKSRRIVHASSDDFDLTHSNGGSGWGPVRCPRGRKACCGISEVAKAWDDDEDDVMEDGNALDKWEELAKAVEECAGDGWEGMGLIDRKPSGWKGKRSYGKEVDWDGGWALLKEWRGEARGWCGWCENIVFSKPDRLAVGLDTFQ